MGKVIEGIGGIKFQTIGTHDLISRALADRGGYEPEILEISRHIIRLNGGRVIDVGANIGTFCIPLAKEFPNTAFTAFEAQPAVYAALLDSIALNGVSNVEAIKQGVSDCAETISASIPDYENEPNIGAFSLDAEVRANDYEVKTVGGMETFSLVPLDDFNMTDVALLKIDVEGMEFKVVAGAAKTLRDSNFPPIIFEAWTWKPFYLPRREMLYQYLQEMGYEIIQIGQNNLAQHCSRANKLHINFV
ncbi:MAG TPA: FkbM family methyltransferase [Rhodocyclaceae bacterium]